MAQLGRDPTARTAPAARARSRRSVPVDDLEQKSEGQAAIAGLQRAIGNRAVSHLIQTTATQAAVTRKVDQAKQSGKPVTKSPEIEYFEVEVRPGGQASGVKRRGMRKKRAELTKIIHRYRYDNELPVAAFQGDKIIVRARYRKLDKRDHPHVPLSQATQSGVPVAPGTWENATTAKWEWLVTKPGRHEAAFSAGDGKHPSGKISAIVDLDAGVDFADYHARVTRALAGINKKVFQATAKINEASKAFNDAHQQQSRDLQETQAEQKLAEDIVFGALFAAAGGYAGAALAGWLKDKGPLVWKLEPSLMSRTTRLKAAERTLEKLDPRSGNVAIIGTAEEAKRVRGQLQDDIVNSILKKEAQESYIFESLNETVQSGVSSIDKYWRDPAGKGGKTDMWSPVGKNPLNFMSELGKITAHEGATAIAAIDTMLADAQLARTFDKVKRFAGDPLARVEQHPELDRIIADTKTDQREYAKELWMAWLRVYGWRKPWLKNAADPREYVEAVPSKLMKRIDIPAKAVGERAVDWLNAAYPGSDTMA